MARNHVSKPQNKSGGGTLIGMFIGLVLGICLAAAGIALYKLRTEPEKYPFGNKQMPQPVKPENAPAANGKNGSPQQPLALPGKPGDPVPQKRFDFYDILPGKSEGPADPKAAAKSTDANEAAKPESKKDEAKPGKETKDAKDAKETKEPKHPVYFQAGSFNSAQDADNQKARLALMGLEASILQVMVQDKTFYRVRLGPYGNSDEAAKVRSELAKAGIDVTLIKKEP